MRSFRINRIFLSTISKRPFLSILKKPRQSFDFNPSYLRENIRQCYPSKKYIFLGLTFLVLLATYEKNEIFAEKPIIDPFKTKIDEFCESQEYQFSFHFSEAIYDQLSWLMYNEISSPELRQQLPNTDLNMEIKRGLSRLYCFDLLSREDISMEDAYIQFVVSQEAELLSFKQFKWLREQTQQLNSNQREAIKASCILTKSQYGDDILKTKGIKKIPADSEEFLIWLTHNPEAMLHFPIVKALTQQQIKFLENIYIPLHGRAIPFTEGSKFMVKEISQLNELWKMRWLTNLMGFRGHEGRGAKYLNKSRFDFFYDCYQIMEKNKSDPDLFPKLWLDHISKKLNLSSHHLNQSERLLVAHIAAFYGEYLPSSKVKEIISGYKNYKQKYPVESKNLVENYQNFTKSNLKTPSYTPAILHTAESLLRDTFIFKLSESPVTVSVEYTLQILQQLHQHHELMETRIISCRNVAWHATMINVLSIWEKSNRKHVKCSIRSPDGDLICDPPKMD